MYTQKPFVAWIHKWCLLVDNIFITSYRSSSSTGFAYSISSIKIERGLFISTKLSSCMNLDFSGKSVDKTFICIFGSLELMEQRQLQSRIDCLDWGFLLPEVKRILCYRKLTPNSFLRNKAVSPCSKYFSTNLSQLLELLWLLEFAEWEGLEGWIGRIGKVTPKNAK